MTPTLWLPPEVLLSGQVPTRPAPEPVPMRMAQVSTQPAEAAVHSRK
jgi:hypothetical protein